MRLKLNCDLGESFGSWKMGADEVVMSHIDQANIACDFHASDAVVMHRTLKLAKTNKIRFQAINIDEEQRLFHLANENYRVTRPYL